MAIVVKYEIEGADSAKYGEVFRQLTEIGERVPDGQMYHICYGDRQRLQVINVYESQAKLDAFGARLGPILHEWVSRRQRPSMRSTTLLKGDRFRLQS